MEELYNMLSSSARIDKSKRRKPNRANHQGTTEVPSIPIVHPYPHKRRRSSETEPHDDTDNTDDDHSNSSNSSDSNETITTTTTTQKKRPTKRHSEEKLQQIHREEVAAFRNKLRIGLSKSNRHDPLVPDPITTFGDIACPKWWNRAVVEDGNGTPEDGPGGGRGGDAVFRSLRTTVVRNIENGSWINPTPIQMQAIPTLLERRDLLGCAPTGSGKSGAFIIPTLFLSSVDDALFYNTQSNIDNSTSTTTSSSKTNKNSKKKSKTIQQPNPSNNGKIRSLLLAPSRELASQLHREVERLGTGKFRGLRSALLSGSNAGNLTSSSSDGGRGLDVLVATPMRLVECLRNGEEHGRKLDLGSVRIVILDEADRLLDSGDGFSSSSSSSSSSNNNNNNFKTFLGQIDTILSELPPTATRALFSATVGSNVRSLAESILRDPLDLSIGSTRSKNNDNTNAASGVADRISQSLRFVGREEGKLLAMRQMVPEGWFRPPIMVFLQSQERAQALYLELLYDGMKIDVIHAGRSRAARDSAVAKFRSGETWVLICTDLCARGLDFKAVNTVVNYDLPTDGVTYVHRIGRCGRAGREGTAVTLFTEADFGRLRCIANVVKLSGCDVPDWMLSLKDGSGGGGGGGGGGNGGRRKWNDKKIPIKRQRIDTRARYDLVKRSKRKQYVQHNKEKAK